VIDACSAPPQGPGDGEQCAPRNFDALASFEYGNRQVARIQAHAARWKDTEAEVNAKAFAMPLKVDVPRRRTSRVRCHARCTAARKR
jgi:hypothetical protein